MKRVAITYTRKVLAEDGHISLVPLPPSKHPLQFLHPARNLPSPRSAFAFVCVLSA